MLRFSTLAILLLTLAAPLREARANGRFPGATQLVVRGNQGAVSTSFGLVTSADKFVTQSWTCEKLVGYDPNAPNELAVALFGDGTLAIAGAAGLSTTKDLGCSTPRHPTFASLYLADVSVDEKEPSSGLVLARGAAGSSEFDGAVYETKDNGATWAQLGAKFPPEFQAFTIDSAPSDPQRLYVSGNVVGADGKTLIGQLRVSADRGASWTVHEIPNQGRPFIGAMHPTDPDTVYVRTINSQDSGDLLVTKDGGKTWRVIATLTGLTLQFYGVTGLAISPDGTKVAYGSVNEGLFVIEGDGPPQKRADVPILCLKWTEDELFACSAPNLCAPFFVGRSTDDGATFTTVMPSIVMLDGKSNCGPSTPASQTCPAEWPAVKARTGGCNTGADAGTGKDADAGAVTPTPPNIDCDCDVAGVGQARPLAVFGGALFVIAAFVQRLRRRRS